jgi:8-oxo-dGTP pyrophosphatase MutT (NUDIX family)
MNEILRAAGICFITPAWHVLLMRRVAHKQSDDGDAPSFPDTWAFPGGGIEGDETPEQAARRECQEETGQAYDGPLIPWTRRLANNVDFTTFLARIDEPFRPTLNDEHDAWNWVDKYFALTSTALHPGVPVTLRRFDMDELSMAKAIRDGELTSPQRYANILLIAIRITGTGLAYRAHRKEHVWRDGSIYLNPEFLERCNGLPVIFEHPDKAMLDTEEFRERVVGTVFLPYVRDDSVWAIAKIFDATAATLLSNEAMSTSPGVVLAVSDDDKHKLSDGSTFLIEGKPRLLDHIAILAPKTLATDSGDAGVWDKGRGLRGVDSIDAGEREPDPLDVILREIQVSNAVRALRRPA